MEHNDDFPRQLKSLESCHIKESKRKVDDQNTCHIFLQNNPIKWEVRWAGSDAQDIPVSSDAWSSKGCEQKPTVVISGRLNVSTMTFVMPRVTNDNSSPSNRPQTRDKMQ